MVLVSSTPGKPAGEGNQEERVTFHQISNSGKDPPASPEPHKKGTNDGYEEKKFSTVPLDWKEVYYTNCPLVSASNVDQELGWTREEYKKIGVKYAYLRSPRRTTGIRTTFTTSTT